MTDFKDIKDPEFDIPEGYFEKMEAQVCMKIHQKEQKMRRRFLIRFSAMTVSAAAVMCGVFFGIKIFNQSSSNDKTIVLHTPEEITAYLQTLQPTYASTEAETTDSVDIFSSAIEMNYLNAEDEYTEEESSYTSLNITETEQYVLENYNIMELATL